MFSGIIETTTPIVSAQQGSDASSMMLVLQKPSVFQDLKVGDSICTNGICLTIEGFNHDSMQFTLGAETIKVLGDGLKNYLAFPMNVERSLRFGDRVHGHLVTGHVEVLGTILERKFQGESLILNISLPRELRGLVWQKGSICVHGVSLTVNSIGIDYFSVCLIPETLKRTNLSLFSMGDKVCLEADYYAKAILSRSENAVQ